MTYPFEVLIAEWRAEVWYRVLSLLFSYGNICNISRLFKGLGITLGRMVEHLSSSVLMIKPSFQVKVKGHS